MLDCAVQLLVRDGVDAMTMDAVADAASASKGTLYTWFGNREGLLRNIIERNAAATEARVRSALGNEADARSTLAGFAEALLTLLVSPTSLALNRAAMTSPALAAQLLSSGRHRVGTLVADYLYGLAERDVLSAPDPEAAFQLLYGLVVQDTQIRVLLGEQPPTDKWIRQHAQSAVDRFLKLST